MKVLSIEQMTKLKELGVDTSKASMCYVFFESDDNKYEKIVVHNEDCYEFASLNPIPTFTLQDVIELLPMKLISAYSDVDLTIRPSIDSTVYGASYEREDVIICRFYNKNILDSVYQMLIWVIKNGHLKTK